MPSYIYKAKKDAVNLISGQISAQNQDDALEFINQLGLIPVSIEESNAEGVLFRDIRAVRIKGRELYLFSKQLASLLKSGLTLLKALEVLSGQTKNAYFSRVISEIAIGVKSGRSFSTSLSDYPAIFMPLFVAMVSAGEEMGKLQQMLNSVADFLRAQEEFSTKVRNACVYPAFMLVIGISTVIFILTFVMPKLSVIFAQAGQVLPWPTRVVMSISHFLKLYGLWAAAGAAIGLAAFRRWSQTPGGAIVIGQFLLNLPFIREFVLKVDLARFTRTLSLLLESGLTIIRSIEMAIPTMHNPQLKADLRLSIQSLTGGENLGQCLGTSGLIPPIMVQLITVGEESGSLQESLKDIAETYESDINETTKMITTVLEPVMIVVVGGVVGFIVFAMLLPIFSMDIMAQ
ncbi:MAG: type II secretion system F family protein [Candidatus Omnitrophica bacterium]|nr:type II secretion system F family protein [Candidatus Omnitrophota bacterium]MDE2009319.1 type II secretion system F family protein [Candidatus Omnitrophota bacterium]MDE2214103.1 type II secretion system F family protein [Candidatus Omnitrophota bacterium]MDE2231140.1 type II secretion system F family protein [Candidatus Omnitrophota bacterium]